MDQSFENPAANAPLDAEAENALLRASLAQMRERVEELERLIDIDGLTGIPNRRRFVAELERTVVRTGRHGTPSSVLIIDLNGLSKINESRGHLAGDAALIHVGKLLAGLIRGSDTLARIGGDEFGVILDHLDQNSAIETSERLARCIARSPVELGGAPASVEASIGVATILPGDSLEDVMRRADRNVALAKNDY
jgi:diguanylate cyclase (GGDEF)-like protein